MKSIVKQSTTTLYDVQPHQIMAFGTNAVNSGYIMLGREGKCRRRLEVMWKIKGSVVEKKYRRKVDKTVR